MDGRIKTHQGFGNKGETIPIPDTIPVFPLPGTVLLPGEILPLHIFEPRYRAMVKDALDGHRVIGMIEPLPDHEDELFGSPPVRDLGCVGFIAEHRLLDDGRYLIWLVGLERFRVVEEKQQNAGYRQFQVEYVNTQNDDSELACLHPLTRELQERLPSLIHVDDETSSQISEQLQEMSHTQLLAFAAQVLELDCDRKRELLEAPTLSACFMMVHEDLYLRLEEAGSLAGLDPTVLN